MTEQELRELKEQIKRELLEEKAQEKQNKNVFNRVFNECMAQADEVFQTMDRSVNARRLTESMRGLIRWVFNAKRAEYISETSAEDVRALIMEIMEVCKPYIVEDERIPKAV